MVTQFDRPLYGFRFADTQIGDTLQIIAARELGDAARWTDLVAFNNLVPPFITDDSSQVQPGVLLSGSQLLVPAPDPVVTATTDPTAVFLTDAALDSGGGLTTVNGDFSTVSGNANLVQALKNRIEVELGDLIFHTDYGSGVRRIIGALNGPTAALLAAEYAKSAVLADSRIDRIDSATATASGDSVSVTVVAITIAGRPITVTATP